MAAWVVIVGSPYAQGKCAQVARRIARVIEGDPGNTAQLFSISDLEVHGCIGCDVCKDEGACIYSDDAQKVHAALDVADAVLVISPIYFAGVPSQLKALLDRFQPYFWKRSRHVAQHQELPAKRPLILALVGEGGDPYGADHAFATLASPLALADLGVCDQLVFTHEDRATIEEALVMSVRNVQEALR